MLACDPSFESLGDALARPHDNCYWLLPGRLLAGEYPGVADPIEQAGRMLALIDVGVRCVIDLTQANEGLPPYFAALRIGAESRQTVVDFKSFPVADFSTPEPATMRRILDALYDAMRDGRTVYLHCRGGVGRTGTVVGCLLVESGYSASQALQLIARKWQVMAKRDRIAESPETAEQREYIARWVHGKPMHSGSAAKKGCPAYGPNGSADAQSE